MMGNIITSKFYELNIPTATGVSFPSASTLVASNWWCNNPFLGVKINRKSLKSI